MKRVVLCVMAALLIFSGCAAIQEDPFRVDTVVKIPVDPTDAPTEPETEAPTDEPTQAPTEASTEAPTDPKETTPKKATTSSKGSSSGKSSSSTSSGKSSSSSNSTSSKNQSTGKKEPAATQPKATEPPATQPPATVVPETVPVTTAATETIPPTEAPTEPPTEPPYDPSSYGVGALEYAIVDEINAYRTGEGLTELSLSGRLSGIAYIRAQEVCSSWSHTRLDGRNYTSAMSDYNYGYGVSAELLAYASGSGDAASMAAKWMSSDSHSANILSSDFSQTGIGVYRAGGMTYVTCLLVG